MRNACCPGSALAVERRVFVTYRKNQADEVTSDDVDNAEALPDAAWICCGCGSELTAEEIAESEVP